MKHAVASWSWWLRWRRRGCVRVKPYERELLAKPTMTFQPDPHEDVLDNHMLEAREGAAGGYGSAGGGCGCN